MNQIDRYTLLEQFHKESHQSIHMAIHKDKDHEIALVNRIDRNGPLSEETFLQLVRHLNNVSFYDIADQFTLVTQYHGGMPLISYVSRMRPSDDDRLQLFNDVLRGMMDYDSLSAEFKSALMDAQQIVVNKGNVNFNEVLFLKNLQNPVDFHQRIRDIGNLILKDVQSPIARHVLAFLQSQAFADNASVKSIFSQCQRLLQGDAMVLVDAYSSQPQSVYIAVDPYLQEPLASEAIEAISIDGIDASVIGAEDDDQGINVGNEAYRDTFDQIVKETPDTSPEVASNDATNNATDDIFTAIPSAFPIDDPWQKEDLVTTPVQSAPTTVAPVVAPVEEVATAPKVSEIHIGLTEKRQKPERQKRTGGSAGALRFIWQGLLLVALLLAVVWYVFLKEETPAPPFASYQVVASKSGWTLQSNAIAYAPATLAKYQWKVIYNSDIIAESDAAEFTFKPKENGDYQIILTVTDSYGQISQPFINVLHFDGTLELPTDQPTTEATEDPLGGIPASENPGEVIEDNVNYQGAPSSQRLFKPSDKRYGILQQKNIFVSKGDVLSLWLKASDLKAVDMYLVGYKDDKVVYEQTWQFTPVTAQFEKTQHTFESHGLDRIELFVQSENAYVWYDSYAIDTIK